MLETMQHNMPYDTAFALHDCLAVPDQLPLGEHQHPDVVKQATAYSQCADMHMCVKVTKASSGSQQLSHLLHTWSLSPPQVLESYYGQDLDSGHHGSGFPLPPFRQRLLDLHLQKQAADKASSRSTKGDSDTGDDSKQRTYTQEETVYSEHAWNINNLPRCKVGLRSAAMLGMPNNRCLTLLCTCACVDTCS